MATSQISEVIQHLRKAVLLRDGAGLTDGQLLEDYISRREEAALAALVRRHGPMVWGVCRRVLRNWHDAEDAFQATFLVLVRKAASIASRELLANWLYAVAYQTALNARAAAARRRARERQVTEMPEPETVQHELWHDLQPLLDQELSRLPDKYRIPIVLCDLEGKTRKQAAHQLGCPEGTVAGRLARARVMLAKRLARHGLALSGGALAAVFAQNVASAGMPTSLASNTIKAATLFAAGQEAAAGVVSAQVAALTEGVLKTMLLTKLKVATALLLSVAMVASLAVRAATRQQTPKPPAQEAKEPQPKHADKPEATVTWKERAVLRGHEDEVVSVAFTGKALLTGGKDDMIRVWDPATGKRLTPEDQGLDAKVWKTYPIDFIAALPDGDKFAVSCTEPGGACINSLGTVSKGVGQGFGSEKVRGLAIASDGKTWALVAHGQEKKPIQHSFPPIQDGLKDFQGEHDGIIRAAAFSPDNATLATASEDKTVKLWVCGTGKERATCKGPTQPVVCVAFAPDGKTVATGSTDSTVWVWYATTAKEVATLRGHEGTVNCLTFTPNGKVLATGGDDKTVALWDVATAKRLAVLKGHAGAVRSVAFSRDAGILASGGQDKEVRLWEQATK